MTNPTVTEYICHSMPCHCMIPYNSCQPWVLLGPVQKESLLLWLHCSSLTIVTCDKWQNRFCKERNQYLLLLLPGIFSVWTGSWHGRHFFSTLPQRWRSECQCRVPSILQQWAGTEVGSCLLDSWFWILFVWMCDIGYWILDDVSETVNTTNLPSVL